jgi:hypothetical protein
MVLTEQVKIYALTTIAKMFKSLKGHDAPDIKPEHPVFSPAVKSSFQYRRQTLVTSCLCQSLEGRWTTKSFVGSKATAEHYSWNKLVDG